MTAILAGSVLLVAVLIFVIVAKPQGTLTLAFLIWALGSTPYTPVPPSLSGLFAASLALVAAAKCVQSDRKLAPFAYTPLAFALAGFFCAPTSLSPRATLADAFGYVLLAVATVAVATTFEGKVVCRSAYIALSVLIVASCIFWFTPLGMLGGRWRGIASNPNTLGLWLFLWIATSFGLSPRHRWISIGLGIPLLGVSGSRGSLLAAAAAIIAGISASEGSPLSPMRRLPFRRTLSILALAVAAVVAYLFLKQSAPEASIIRPGDSGRSQLNSLAWALFKEHPVFGIGLNTDGSFRHPHNQLFTILVSFGLIGFAALSITVISLLRTPWRHCAPLSALVWGSLVSWGTEAWMLGVGGICAPILFFAVSAYATDARSRAQLSEEHTWQGTHRSHQRTNTYGAPRWAQGS